MIATAGSPYGCTPENTTAKAFLLLANLPPNLVLSVPEKENRAKANLRGSSLLL
jgi:hypothetical protein